MPERRGFGFVVCFSPFVFRRLFFAVCFSGFSRLFFVYRVCFRCLSLFVYRRLFSLFVFVVCLSSSYRGQKLTSLRRTRLAHAILQVRKVAVNTLPIKVVG